MQTAQIYYEIMLVQMNWGKCKIKVLNTLASTLFKHLFFLIQDHKFTARIS